MSVLDADKNLLFGILALQMDFITRDALILAMNAWVLDKKKPLAQILINQKSLADDEHALLDAVVRKHLAKHGGDPRQSLAAVSSVGSAHASLAEIPDPDVQASLAPLRNREISFIPTAAPNLDDFRPEKRRFGKLRHHAKGGLGVVYVAHDSELTREVALKEIQENHADDLDSRARFVREAEITGALEHPGIVPVYGLGSYGDGRPYYAMRFIRGETLKDVIADFHHANCLPNRKAGDRALALRKLLGRFIDVCDAMDYAHNRGVLHRDLKPGNIMIGKYGETLIVDWGLAKTVDGPVSQDHTAEPRISSSSSGSSETLAGSAVGTPQYMSPEQAAGRLDLLCVTSDVYSLGATLYSLLTGQPPFSVDDVAEVLKRVQKGNIPAPRSVSPQIPKPLEAICLKAMSLSPADRYPSPRNMAEDIEHWLADEPIAAYPEAPIGRLLRWGRHHMPLVTGVGALLVTGVFTLSMATVVVSESRRRENHQKQLALANFEIAKDGADTILLGVSDVELAEIPEMESVRRDLLNRAKQSYSQFLEQRSDDPLVRWGAGRALARLGDIERLLGNSSVAESSYGRSILLLSALVKEFPRTESYRQDLARAHHGLGILQKLLNRFTEAEASLHIAIELREALALAESHKSEAEEDLAESRYYMGTVLAKTTHHQSEDEVAYNAAIEAQQRLIEGFGKRVRHREKLARYFNNLGMLQASSGRPIEASITFNKGLALYEKVDSATLAMPGPRWQWARLDNNIAVLNMAYPDRFENAERLLRDASEILEDLVHRYPQIPQYRQELASVCSNLGLLEIGRDRRNQAVIHYKRALSLLDDLVSQFADVPDYIQKHAICLCDLHVLLSEIDPKAGAQAFDKALAEQNRLVSTFPNVPDYCVALGRSLYERAGIATSRHSLADARRYLELAIRYHKDASQARPDNQMFKAFLIDDYGELAKSLINSGDYHAAALAAEELPLILGERLRPYLDAAALLAKCAEQIREPEEKVENLKSRSIEVLRQAIKKKLLTDPEIFDLPAWRFIQDQEGFHRLRSEVQAAIDRKSG